MHIYSGSHWPRTWATIPDHKGNFGRSTTSTDFRVSASLAARNQRLFAPGSGKTMDLMEGGSCVSFQVQVQDANSTRVELDLDPPIEPGYEFNQPETKQENLDGAC